jgi:hypothetical protein
MAIDAARLDKLAKVIETIGDTIEREREGAELVRDMVIAALNANRDAPLTIDRFRELLKLCTSVEVAVKRQALTALGVPEPGIDALEQQIQSYRDTNGRGESQISSAILRQLGKKEVYSIRLNPALKPFLERTRHLLDAARDSLVEGHEDIDIASQFTTAFVGNPRPKGITAKTLATLLYPLRPDIFFLANTYVEEGLVALVGTPVHEFDTYAQVMRPLADAVERISGRRHFGALDRALSTIKEFEPDEMEEFLGLAAIRRHIKSQYKALGAQFPEAIPDFSDDWDNSDDWDDAVEMLRFFKERGAGELFDQEKLGATYDEIVGSDGPLWETLALDDLMDSLTTAAKEIGGQPNAAHLSQLRFVRCWGCVPLREGTLTKIAAEMDLMFGESLAPILERLCETQTWLQSRRRLARDLLVVKLFTSVADDLDLDYPQAAHLASCWAGQRHYWGIGVHYGQDRSEFMWDKFSAEGCVAIGWSREGKGQQAHEQFAKLKKGDLVAAKSFSPQVGISVYGLGVVDDDQPRESEGLGTTRQVKWYRGSTDGKLIERHENITGGTCSRTVWPIDNLEHITMVFDRLGSTPPLHAGGHNSIPPTPSYGSIYDHLATSFHFPNELVTSYLLALSTKPFVILSGISGTGKTKLAQEVARWATGGAEPDRSLFVPVRPDWLDGKDVLGFYNIVTEQYELRPFLRLLLSAHRRPDLLHFVILDEMNIARVEHYFADLLSAMESRVAIEGKLSQEPILLHSRGRCMAVNPPAPNWSAGRCRECQVTQDDIDGCPLLIDEVQHVPPQLKLPTNVFITGTVNIDETTHMFSPKVLDRANVIELNTVDLEDYAAPDDDEAFVVMKGFKLRPRALPPSREDYLSAPAEAQQSLMKLNKLLARYTQHFGYRVVNEIAAFIKQAVQHIGEGALGTALDLQVLQKVLPKLHGSKQKLLGPLGELLTFCVWPEAAGHDEKDLDEIADQLASGMDPVVVHEKSMAPWLPRSARKLARMRRSLSQQGFVSFIE